MEKESLQRFHLSVIQATSTFSTTSILLFFVPLLLTSPAPKQSRIIVPSTMVSQNSFRKMALSLDGAEESAHFDKASFRIKKKIFATLSEKENRAMLKLSPEDQSVYCLYSPAFTRVPGTWGAGGATFVSLGQVKMDVLKEALTAAYSLLKK